MNCVVCGYLGPLSAPIPSPKRLFHGPTLSHDTNRRKTSVFNCVPILRTFSGFKKQQYWPEIKVPSYLFQT